MFQYSIDQSRKAATPPIRGVETGDRIARLCLLFVALLLSLTATVQAQTGQGAIAGKVTDTSGAVVQNATVQVTNDETLVSLRTKTNSAGAYNIQSLNPGDYTVTVTLQGFEKEVVHRVTVGAAQQPTINVVLKVGQESTEVTVSAQSALLSTDTSDVTTTVDHEIVLNLPYPERSSLEAALLVPGVTGDPSVSGGIFSENPPITTGAVVPGASITIGGGPPGTVSILIDGSDVTQGSYARAGINLSGHDVQETTVLTTGLSAKYGRTSAGVIVQVSKAGTNQYHGGVTWRHTDPFFNAFPLGSTAANAQHENFYGFYASGPVWIPKVYNGHEKTFFFVGVEPARINNVLGFRGSFDTPDDLAGHMHNSLAILNQTVLKASGYAAAVATTRVGAPVNSPATSPGMFYQTALNPQGFPMGKTSAALVAGINGPNGPDDLSAQLAQNPFAQFVLSQLPTPTNPGPYIAFDNTQGTYQNDGTNATYKRGVNDVDNRYSFRIDHQFNNNNQIYGRYTVIPISGARFFALAIDNPLNQVVTDTVTSFNAALGYTHVFSSSVVNELHYSYLRVNNQRTPPASALGQDFAAKYGLTPATLGKGFPALGTLGTSTLQIAAGVPYAQVDDNYILGDNVTWTHGSHLFQFGADLRWIQSNEYDTANLYGGKYAFASGQSANGLSGGAGGSALATFILGTISSYSAAPVSVPGYYRWKYFAGYAQDDWHFTPKLTLNLGLRYDVSVPRQEKNNNQAFVQLNTPGTLNGVTTNTAFCFSGACGTGTSIWPINWYGIQPRIGISYAPTSRMTVRASYGILRMPLTGYENLPDPNFNVASATVGNQVGGTTANSTVNYITNKVGPLTSSYTALNGNRGPILSSSGLSPVYVSQSGVVPYTQSYSLTVQYQPASHTLLQATYSALKGTHLIGPFTGSLNVPSVPTLVAAVQNHAYLSGTTVGNAYGITQDGTSNTAVINESNLQLLNPYQNFFNQPLTTIYPRTGASNYNSFYASVNQRYGRGLSLITYYSWSKSLDNVPDTNPGNSGDFGSAPPQNPFDSTNEKSVSSFDQPSRLKVGYVYELPIGKGHWASTHNHFFDQVIGNIKTAGILTFASGFPNYLILGSTGYFTSFTPTGTNGCTAAKGNSYCSSSALPAGYALRPNIVPGVPLINPNWKPGAFTSTFTPYLNPDAFATPGTLNNPALGNAPRTLANARSPREFLFDAHVSKGFAITDRYLFKFTGTFNNVFNHPVYFAANSTANDPLQKSATANLVTGTITINSAATTFGKLNPNTANLSRVIRVGAEFTF